MTNFDDVAKVNKKLNNSYLLQVTYNTYRILKIGGSGSGKTNSLFNLISYRPDIDKIHLYAKDPHEENY